MSLKAHAARRPEQFRPDLAASAERVNLARCKARARTRLGFHNRREVSKSHFAAVHESGIGTFRTWLLELMMSVHRVILLQKSKIERYRKSRKS
jgi:hypothetical protein